ncbi:LysR family transcriptional regulator [Spongiibacter sp.]|uniref:LysR family transcriptional regulator n=1 Tax=Spongiibacter sp. TaxID=2024860 RepID=UPI003561EEB2
MYDDIALFVHIAQQGGLSSAAKHLGLPAATVTRRLQKLEQRLGYQLLQRSARQCVLTVDGEVLYHSYAELIEQLEQVRQQLYNDMRQLRGKLRVLAPSNISHGMLRPMWLGFTRQYPDIQLELQLSNQLHDMIKARADIALRIGPQADSALYQKKLGQVDKILVAAPSYLKEHGHPAHPGELKHHRLVGTTISGKWPLHDIESSKHQEILPRFVAQFNDTTFAKYMAIDGQGITLLPLSELKPELDSGELQRVLPQWRGEPRDIYAVWPSGRLLSAKAKCLRDYMAAFIVDRLTQVPSRHESKTT